MTTSRFIVHGDARIHCLDSGGDDQGAPIFFIPGMTDVAEDYTEVLPLFGRRTVVIELRGHGRSNAPESGYDLTTLSRDVGAVIDAITGGPIHLVTFSRGTCYAVEWVLAHPDRVRSLSIGDYVAEERVLSDARARQLLDGRWRGSPVRDRLDVDAAMATFRSARARSFWLPLSQLQPPLLVARSPHSPLISTADWVRYRNQFPTATLLTFEDSPHDIFRPARGRYPRLVQAHVDRVDGIALPSGLAEPMVE